MDEEILKKHDYEDIDFLINISRVIKENYEQLYKIEKEFGKSSIEYKNCIEELKKNINIEKNIYNRINTSSIKCHSVIKYLTNLGKYNTTLDSYDLLLNDSYDIEISRIIINLNYYMIDQKITNELNKKNGRIIDSSIKYILLLHNMRTDNIKSFLAILNQENIDDLTIYMKYKVSYLFSEIEQEFINNEFEIDKNPYSITRMYNDILYKDDYIMNETRLKLFVINFVEQIKIFRNCYNLELQNLKVKNDLIKRIFLLRALLIFIEDKEIGEFKEQFNKVIENSSANVIKALELLGKCFDYQKQDLRMLKILTFKKI